MTLATMPLHRAGAYPALILNADYRCLNTFPLATWTWHQSICGIVNGIAGVVHEHDKVVHSQNLTMRLPSVVVLKEYVKAARKPAFTKRNIMLRDQFCCVYCGHKFPADTLTWDHVLPRAQGGKTTWENMATACGPCNQRKDAHTPEQAKMPLLWRPWRPTAEELRSIGSRVHTGKMYNGWDLYLNLAA